MADGTVLVVDDSEVVLEAVRLTLEAHGYHVIGLTSPFQLLETVHRHPVDVILVDLEMPALTGDKVIEITRKSWRAGPVPMLLFSPHSAEQVQTLIARSGADGHIEKTADDLSLLQQIAAWVHESRRRRGIDPALARKVR